MRRTATSIASAALVMTMLCAPSFASESERPFQTALSLLPADVHTVRGLRFEHALGEAPTKERPAIVTGMLRLLSDSSRFPLSEAALSSSIGTEVLIATRVRNPDAVLLGEPGEIDWWFVLEGKQLPQTLEEWRKLVRTGVLVDAKEERTLFVSADDKHPLACGGIMGGHLWLSSACEGESLPKTRGGESASFEQSASFRELVARLNWPETALDFYNFPALRNTIREPALRDALRGDAEALAKLEVMLRLSDQAAAPYAMVAATRGSNVSVTHYGRPQPLLAKFWLDHSSESDRSVETAEKALRSQREAANPRNKTSPPELLQRVEPIYPAGVKISKHADNRVILLIVVDRSGAVTMTHAIGGVSALDLAAIQAVRQWKYKPAMKNGQPRAAYVTVTIEFKPADAP